MIHGPTCSHCECCSDGLIGCCCRLRYTAVAAAPDRRRLHFHFTAFDVNTTQPPHELLHMRVQAACWHELQRGGGLLTTKWVICSLIYSQYDSVRTKNKNAHSHPLAGRHIETLHWNRSWRHIIRTIRRSLRDNGTIGVFLRPHNNTHVQ